LNPDFIRLQRIFREVLEDEALQLSPEHSQRNLPNWDSFAQVKLIIGLEEEFDVKFSIDEAAETKSVDGLLRLVRAKTGK
jgi:acyl carrier protein